MDIKSDDLSHPEIIHLLNDHLGSMSLHSPPESIHALDIEALKDPDICFWSVWADDDLMGCGALKKLDKYNAEVKSMKTAPKHLRKGVASYLLSHIVREAQRSGYRRIFLETGSMMAFDAARCLYKKFGFVYCEPFADYVDDPNSVFMLRTL